MFKLQSAKQSSPDTQNKPNPLSKQSLAALSEQAALAEELIAQEKAYRYGVVNIRDLIAPASLEIKPKYLLLNGQYVSTMFIITYPRYISVG